MRVAVIGIVVSALSTVACGSKSPTSPPPPPTPQPTSISISGTDILRTGQAQTYTATITLSNGTTQAATPNWTSDNSSVLTINASSGQATAAGQGTATITATAQSVSATRSISVYQDYQGTWEGLVRIRVCTEQGVFVGNCRAPFYPPGSLRSIRITLTQTGASASGTLQFTNTPTTLSGGIFASRRFVGGGSGSYLDGGRTFLLNIGTFDVLSASATMTGSVIATFSAPSLPGNVYVEADLAGVTRTGSTASQSSSLTSSGASVRVE